MAKSKKNKAPVKHAETVKKPSIPTSVAKMAGAAFAAIIAVRGIAGFFPEARLWGVNHFAFLPEWEGIALTVLGFMLCGPWLYRVFLWKASALFGEQPSILKRMGLPALLVLAGVAFWFFRMGTYFLGDGAVYLAELYRLQNNLPTSDTVLYSLFSAPLTGLLHAGTAKLQLIAGKASELDAISTQFPFQLLGLVAGLVFIAFIWNASKLLTADPSRRLGLIAMLLFLPGTVFFFGYVEYYTLVYVAIVVAMFFQLGTAIGKVKPIAAILATLVAIPFHFLSFVLIPGLLLSLAAASPNERFKRFLQPRTIALAIAGILAVSAVYYFASGVYAHGSRVLISLFPFGGEGTMQEYTLLSSYHLFDILNLLFLFGAPCIVLLLLFWKQADKRDPVLLIALVNLFFVFCLGMFVYSGFGLARDWDIIAPLGPAFVFAAFAIIRRLADGETARYAAYLGAGGMLVGGLAWFPTLIVTDSSINRYKAIMELDAWHIPGDFAQNGFEHLRKYYRSIRDDEGVLYAMRKKIDAVGYPSDLRALVTASVDLKSAEERDRILAQGLESVFGKMERMKARGADSLYSGTKREYEELAVEFITFYYDLHAHNFEDPFIARNLERLETYVPNSPIAGILKGYVLFERTGAVKDAGVFVRGGDALVSSTSLGIYAALPLMETNNLAPAKRILEKVAEKDTEFVLPLYYLAEIEYRLGGDALRMEHYLTRFLNEPDHRRLPKGSAYEQQLIQQAESMLQSIQTAPAP